MKKKEDHVPSIRNGVSMNTEARIKLASNEQTSWRVLMCGLQKKEAQMKN